MKIKGSYFRRCMESNLFQIADGKINVHSFAKDGTGMFRVLNNDADPEDKETVEFFIKKSDADIISAFDELDMEVNEETNSIVFRSDKTVIRFQNQTSIQKPKPNIAETVLIKLGSEEFVKASALSEKDAKNMGNITAGLVFCRNGLMLYDSSLSVYYRYCGPDNCGPEVPIRVPVAILKLAEPKREYSIRLSEKLMVFMSESEILYSGVYAGHNAKMIGYDPKPDGTMTIDDAASFMEHIRMAGAFNSLVRISIKTDLLTIENYLDNDDPRLYSAEMAVNTNIEEYSILINAKAMNHMFSGLEVNGSKPLVLGVNDTLIRSDEIDRYMVMAACSNPDNVKLKLKGTDEDGEQ